MLKVNTFLIRLNIPECGNFILITTYNSMQEMDLKAAFTELFTP